MFENKKVIIFDMDGTLIDSVGIWNKTDEILIRQISRNEKIEIEDMGQMRDSILAQCKTENIYLEYCEYLGKKYKSDMTSKEINDLRKQISDEYLKYQVDYKPNADELLHLLKRKGYIIALATTTTNKQLDIYRTTNEKIKQKADIDKIFDLILTQDDITERKPNPEVHNKILQKLNVEPRECLIIEDSLIGVQAGANAGIDVAVMYDKYSDADREEINRLSQYQFNNFEEIINRLKDEVGIKL